MSIVSDVELVVRIKERADERSKRKIARLAEGITETPEQKYRSEWLPRIKFEAGQGADEVAVFVSCFHADVQNCIATLTAHQFRTKTEWGGRDGRGDEHTKVVVLLNPVIST